jgi:PKD repeat protein
VDPLTGNLPLTINFDASASTDPEGGTLNFQWDFNGDGIFDLNSGSDATVSFLYTIAGSFDVHLRVSDPDGGVTIKSLSDLGISLIDILGGGGDPNQDPIAALSLDINLGTAPLTVNFDASASVDLDGTIVKFEWDFDGDGIFDLDSDIDATVENVFNLHGIFNSVLRVTDDDGATDTISVLDLLEVGIHVNAPPVADFDVDSLLGILTLLVNFDASASVDEDGVIAEVAWDFDGDGVFDEESGLLGLLTSHLYIAVGVFDPVLRITDDFGAVDFCSLSETGSDLIEIKLL